MICSCLIMEFGSNNKLIIAMVQRTKFDVNKKPQLLS